MGKNIAIFVLYIIGVLAASAGLDYTLSPDNILQQESFIHQIAQYPSVYYSSLVAYFGLVIWLQFSYKKAGYDIY